MNMDFERARFNMVEQQIRTWEVLDQNVLDLLFVVKREEFVPPAYRNLAFADLEVPIGHGQTMLQPKLEARILQEVQVQKTDKVLEIGAGSGYMAALLGARAASVTTVELLPPLVEMARGNLARAGVDNVAVVQGDGARGWSAGAPYDVIVISASTPVLPHEFLDQLKVGGRLVAIVGVPPVMTAQLITCTAEGTFQTVNLFETNVAPLTNAQQKERFVF